MIEFYSKKNDREVYLFAELDKNFFLIEKRSSILITQTYILYQLTKNYISILNKAEKLIKIHCQKLKLLYDSFYSSLDTYKSIIISLGNDENTKIQYLRHKSSIFNDCLLDIKKRIDNLNNKFSINGNLRIDISISLINISSDKNLSELISEYEFKEKKLIESLKLNSDCVLIAIKEYFIYLSDNNI